MPEFELPFRRSQWIEINMLYSCAMREMNARLENLNQEFQMRGMHNPINHIEQRLKTPESIVEKMQRRGLPLDYDIMREEITDIAGIRVICSYIDDIYALASMLRRHDDLVVVNVKDYIAYPKPNGYRSYHVIIGIPVFFSDKKETIPVEVQMRTMAMDFWASLEHSLRYKNNGSVPDDIRLRLSTVATEIYNADVEMQEISRSIEALSSGK